MSTVKEIAITVAELVEKKNSDYDKAFEKSVEKYGPTSYLLRMDDKLNRLYSLMVKNNIQQIENENIEDTIKDIIGYSLLMLEMMQ